eukprot:4341136-Alexandrium_andersonii.AAC.1
MPPMPNTALARAPRDHSNGTTTLQASLSTSKQPTAAEHCTRQIEAAPPGGGATPASPHGDMATGIRDRGVWRWAL